MAPPPNFPHRSSTRRCFFGVLLLGRLAHAQLIPLGTPINPFATNQVEQMAFDATNRTLYLASHARHTIVQVSQVSSAPLLPPTSTPWSFSIVAGRDGVGGFPSPTAVSAANATFENPTGVVGLPQYAVGPTTSLADGATSGATIRWVGLWVADYSNNALRFIHFLGENNVTLVAGSPVKASGALDGVGAAALLNNPLKLAWGRFLRSVVVQSPNESTSNGAWTTVVIWGDASSNCLRQGIPVSFSTSLSNMVLNVSSFAGLCGPSNSGSGVGLVLPWSPMFQ